MNAILKVIRPQRAAQVEAPAQGRPAAPRRLRLAYLVSEYPALSHTFITREIAELEKHGHEVERVSVRPPKSALATTGDYADEHRRTFYLLREVPRRLPLALARMALANPLGLWRAAWLAARIALRLSHRPHAVAAWLAQGIVLADWMRSRRLGHVHNHFGNAAGFIALLAAETGAVDFSLSVHGPDIFNHIGEEMLALKIQRARFTRCISHFSRSQLCLLADRLAWRRIQIVRCGVDPEAYHPRHRSGESAAFPRVLCVGRLVAAKGQHLLLEASARLLDRGLLHHLTLVGTGPDEQALRDRAKRLGIEEWVTFTGGLPPEEVKARFSEADLFVLPSFAEGIPVVLMEAMAMEIPVITTPVAGIPELVEHGRSGALVPPASAEALIGAIGDFILHPEKWRPFGRRGRERVLADFDQERNGRAMVSLFESQLS
ncbi:MAG: glycosyltransferase [Verrucomicrobiae bacterium]|nr:glycosyltransferase [Verrucomicrobiae bacterium]MCB1089889.1 glycosyltransferase [Verrucomicrobiae bacterium]